MKGLSISVALLVIVCIAACIGCGSSDGNGNGGTSFDPAGYAGDWDGSWTNTTFASQGDTSATVVVDDVAKTVTFTLDVDGNALGGGDPPPVVFTGAYTSTGMSFSATGTAFGDVVADVNAKGAITATITNVPGGGINSVNITGSIGATAMNLSYTVNFTGGGTAAGTMTLTKT